jgi:hypothetical protein
LRLCAFAAKPVKTALNNKNFSKTTYEKQAKIGKKQYGAEKPDNALKNTVL